MKLTTLALLFLLAGAIAVNAQPAGDVMPFHPGPEEMLEDEPMFANRVFEGPMDMEPLPDMEMEQMNEMEPKEDGSMNDSGRGRKNLLKELQLSDEQLTKIKEIRVKSAKEMIDVTSSMKKKRIDMKSLMDSDTPKRSDVEKLTREIAELQIQLRMLGFDTRTGIMNILTPEQKTKFKELTAQRREGMKMKFRGQMKHRMQRGE